ncbi:hypothetical protein HYX10_01375 [Candidatus Woesearchaeota archaeon]|nr:hypothetical protein [Candidatus Woesearchaeota archaeon]
MEQEATAENLQCRFMLELMGAPKDHVEKTLKLVLNKLKDENGVTVNSGNVHPAKENDELFSTFAELDANFKDFSTLTRICFDYMPSSLEIVSPEHFRMPALHLSDFVSDTLGLLHSIDFKLKDVNAKNQLLERNSANLMKNFLLLILSSGKKPISEISKAIGIKPEQLEPFMDAYSKEGLIRKAGDLWEKV